MHWRGALDEGSPIEEFWRDEELWVLMARTGDSGDLKLPNTAKYK